MVDSPSSPPAVSIVVTDEPDLTSTDERTIVDLRGLDPFVAIGRYRYLHARDPLPEQVHERLFVLALPLRGAFEFVLDGEIVSADQGMAVLIRPGTAYRTSVDAQSRGELLWLVTRALDGRRQDLTPVDHAIHTLIASTGPTRYTSTLTVDLLTRVVTADEGTIGSLAEWRRALCVAAVLELVREAAGDRTPLHPQLRRALEWAAAHVGEPIRAEQLVEASGMSATHFYSVFTRTMGTTPKDYILRLKMDRSRRALLDSDESITMIAHSLGFASSQHFSTAFRRYVGTSPTEFRSRRV